MSGWSVASYPAVSYPAAFPSRALSITTWANAVLRQASGTGSVRMLAFDVAISWRNGHGDSGNRSVEWFWREGIATCHWFGLRM
jgi:hypothetical protein